MVSFIVGGKYSEKITDLPQVTSKLYDITLCCIEYTLPWVGFKLKILVVIGTDCMIAYIVVYPTTIHSWPWVSLIYNAMSLTRQVLLIDTYILASVLIFHSEIKVDFWLIDWCLKPRLEVFQLYCSVKTFYKCAESLYSLYTDHLMNIFFSLVLRILNCVKMKLHAGME